MDHEAEQEARMAADAVLEQRDAQARRTMAQGLGRRLPGIFGAGRCYFLEPWERACATDIAKCCEGM